MTYVSSRESAKLHIQTRQAAEPEDLLLASARLTRRLVSLSPHATSLAVLAIGL